MDKLRLEYKDENFILGYFLKKMSGTQLNIPPKIGSYCFLYKKT
jgi:hypothetical protein